MTQEDKQLEVEKQLLLVDLCARLPYGVKVEVNKGGLQNYDNYWNGWSFEERSQEIDGVYVYGVTFDCMEISNGVIPFEFIKPYLFPLSSMTEERRKEWQSLMIRDSYGILYPTIDSFDYLYKNHIDIRGLIEKGLAIDCTNLNIY